MGKAKYALIDFFQRDEVEIVDTKDTRVQAECEGMEWDNARSSDIVFWRADRKETSEEIYRKSITL